MSLRDVQSFMPSFVSNILRISMYISEVKKSIQGNLAFSLSQYDARKKRLPSRGTGRFIKIRLWLTLIFHCACRM